MSSKPSSIPWCEPRFDQGDIDAVARSVSDGFVNEGPRVRDFEAILRAYFDVPYAVMTPSGTMALALSLMVLGIGRGHSVLVPDITFIGTAGAVRLAGAEPVLVDVDPRSFVMDPDHARQRLRPDTHAILPVHLNGRAAPMPELHALAEEHGCVVVEDAAEAIGSESPEGKLGTLSHAGCFSLAPTKIITSGQGGFVLTANEKLKDQLIRLKDHGRLSRTSDVHPVTGYNFKVTDMQGALACSQWAKLSRRIDAVRELDRRYREGLSDLPQIEFTARPDPTSGAYLMWPDFVCQRRDELVAWLKERRILLRPYWPPIHTQPAYLDHAAFPGADEAARTACWLPATPGQEPAVTDRVIDTIRQFYDHD